MKVEGTTVWITGASSGIGEALALQLADLQCSLILSARSEDKLEAVKQKVESRGGKAEVLPLDLTQSDTFQDKAQEAATLFGGIDILVNNGGISQRAKASEASLEIDRQVMEVNFFGAIGLTKAALPYLNKGASHIVVISSVVGKFGFPLRSAYAASKHALHGFFESFALEEKENGVRVTLVMPGRIKTNISKNALTKDGSKHGEMDAGQANGISAEVCARKIIRAVEHNKREVLIARGEAILVQLRRFIPSLFYYAASKVNPK